MIPPIKAIRKILWGNIILNDKVIPVIQRPYPYDKTPCITIDDSGGSRFLERQITNEKYPLPNNHPQFDVENPFRKHPQQVLREKYDTTININIWCDSGDELEQLNHKVQELFYQAQSDHYLFCDNYREGTCAYLGVGCYGEHFATNNRSVKKQCPNPLVYNYKNIFTTYNLIRASFHLDQPFTLVDMNREQAVYHSVLKLHTAYYTDYIIGGLINDKIINEDIKVL